MLDPVMRVMFSSIFDWPETVHCRAKICMSFYHDRLLSGNYKPLVVFYTLSVTESVIFFSRKFGFIN